MIVCSRNFDEQENASNKNWPIPSTNKNQSEIQFSSFMSKSHLITYLGMPPPFQKPMDDKFQKDSRGSLHILNDIVADRPEFSLNEVLRDPKLIKSFEEFLTRNWAQENLLFIEAMNQLRHEPGSLKDTEEIFKRIYDTFIAVDSPLELNIKTQEKIKERIGSLQWSVITRADALDILEETENEVLNMLRDKLTEFHLSPLVPVSSRQSRIDAGPVSLLRKRVVIVGGGFTGFTVASILDPMSLFHVTLIDTKDSFEYTPHIVFKIVNPEKSSSFRFTHESYIRNGRIIIGYAEDICNDARYIKVNDELVYFDYLVLGTGSSYAGQLKSSDFSSLYRSTGINKVSTDIKNARKILIIGAGLVGCELAAAIGKKQRDLPASEKKQIILVEARDEIICRADEEQRKKAEAYLIKLGVEIVLKERIIYNAQDSYYYGSSGNVYSEKEYLVLMATGVKLNTGFILTSTNEPSLDTCIDSNGSIRVRPTLQIEHWKYNHIFAGGDTTNVVEEKTAYAATIAGVCIARNICRMEKGKDPIPQGTKGLLPPPASTLHGVKSQGGIGKKQLSFFERKFSFLNPTWHVLKYFNEEQFFKIVQETSKTSNILGKRPKALSLLSQQNKHTCNDIPIKEGSMYRFKKGSEHLTTDYHLNTKIY